MFYSNPIWKDLRDFCWKQPQAGWHTGNFWERGGSRVGADVPVGVVITRGSLLLQQNKPSLKMLLRELALSDEFTGLNLHETSALRRSLALFLAVSRNFLISAGSDPVILYFMPYWLTTQLTKTKSVNAHPFGSRLTRIEAVPEYFVFSHPNADMLRAFRRGLFRRPDAPPSFQRLTGIYKNRESAASETSASDFIFGWGVSEAMTFLPASGAFRINGFGRYGAVNCRNVMLARFQDIGVDRPAVIVENVVISIDPHEHELLSVGQGLRSYSDFWRQTWALGQLVSDVIYKA